MNSLKIHSKKIGFFFIIALLAGGYFYFWTFQPEFSSDEIVKVELIKVRAGVETLFPLAPERNAALYRDLRWSRSLGIAKMFTCYRIRVTTSGGKIFNFRTNGTKFFSSKTDTLYSFGGDENRVVKYWNMQPNCSDLNEK